MRWIISFKLPTVVLPVLAMLMPGEVFADPPNIRTRSIDFTGSRADCLDAVQHAVEKAGFSKLDIDSNDVEAENGDYKTETICMDRKILIIVSGPSNSQSGVLRDAIASRL